MNRPIDIVITSYPKDQKRCEITTRSFDSFQKTVGSEHRVTVVMDGSNGDMFNLDFADHIITHQKPLGLGPSVNDAMVHISSLNRWYTERGELDRVSDMTCYLQDDIIYSEHWIEKLSDMFLRFVTPLRLGFASGVECPEHPLKKDHGIIDGQRVWTKDWVRMTCLLSWTHYWQELMPIPGMDPETGQKRARPHDGIGSGCDWWLIRNHPQSVCRSGRTNLVLPGLLRHIGWQSSTWLDRDLPESEDDKRAMCEISS